MFSLCESVHFIVFLKEDKKNLEKSLWTIFPPISSTTTKYWFLVCRFFDSWMYLLWRGLERLKSILLMREVVLMFLQAINILIEIRQKWLKCNEATDYWYEAAWFIISSRENLILLQERFVYHIYGIVIFCFLHYLSSQSLARGLFLDDMGILPRDTQGTTLRFGFGAVQARQCCVENEKFDCCKRVTW
jgi:hypothetical protein